MLLRLVTRTLLLAFPREFRARIGQPLVQTLLTDSRTPSGRLSIWRFGLGAADVVRAGLGERLRLDATTPDGRRGRATLETLSQEVRHAFRSLNRSRGFAAVAILTLALGIGANTAVFQLLDAVQLRTLPVARPNELAEIRITDMTRARGNFTIWHAGATNGIWEETRRRQDAFSTVFAWSPGGARLRTGSLAEWVSATLVSGEYFPTLGVQPTLGRLLTPADDTRGCSAPGLVLGHAFWQSAFGKSPDVIGRKVTVGGSTHEILGVAPEDFVGLDVGHRFDIAIPLCAEWLPPGSPNRLTSGVDWFLVVMGRLKPGVDLSEAGRRLRQMSPEVFSAALPANYPADNVKDYLASTLTALDGSRGISGLRERYAGPLWFLQATALIVLLVGCANLANLMLARGATRERELAARLALGASRAHLVRVLLAEAVLLSLAGALLGAGFASGASAALVLFLDGGSNNLILGLPFDWRILIFVSIAATATCVLAGLVPAWRAAGVSAETVLRSSGRGLTDNRAGAGFRRAMVAAQVALSLALVAGALLFARSLGNLVMQDLGFRIEGLTAAYVDTSGMNVPAERRRAFKQRVLADLERVPGVVAAAETSAVPLSGSYSDNEVWPEGGGPRAVSAFMETSRGYFRAMEMRLAAGRTFDDDVDTPGSTPVAVVNEAFVAKFLPGPSAIGRRFWREARAEAPATLYEVVGVVPNAKYQDVRQPLVPTAYLAIAQDPRPSTFMQIVIRTALPKSAIEPTLRDAFREIGPAIISAFSNMRGQVDRSLAQDQLLAGLSGFFGLLAVLLAAVGVYGSLSFAVSRRTKEIGVRMALGADRRGIYRLILGDSAVVVAAGCALGLGLATLLERTVAQLAFNVAAFDPWTTLAACGVLLIVALAASAGPARRAARLDPMGAVRTD